MTSNVILSGLVFWVFLFCKFRRDLSSFTDTMAAEGICEQKNTYWLYVIAYWLLIWQPYNAKRTSYNQLSIKQVKLR